MPVMIRYVSLWSDTECLEIPDTYCTAMPEQVSERLRRARTGAGFENARAASDAFGWNAATYRCHENGVRGVSAQRAERYVRAFHVGLNWLLTGSGDTATSQERSLAPLLGTVGRHGMVNQATGLPAVALLSEQKVLLAPTTRPRPASRRAVA